MKPIALVLLAAIGFSGHARTRSDAANGFAQDQFFLIAELLSGEVAEQDVSQADESGWNGQVPRLEAVTAVSEIEKSKCKPENGEASWYGGYFHGRKTASGERFNTNSKTDMTAAHKTLPIGTRVRVTNKRNGLSVIVRINDRGPFIRGRVIDVSHAAAKAIDIDDKGIGPVQLTCI